MKLNIKISALLVLCLSLFVLAACGGQSSGGTSTDENSENSEVVESDRPSTVIIGTASQGGTYFIFGGGLAGILESELDVTANVEVTGGPIHNIQLTNSKQQDIGMITLGPGYEAINGEGEWTGGEKFNDFRIIFPMYTTPFQWWALESSGITSLEQTAGHRIGVGPAGGTGGTYIPIIQEFLGVDVTPVHAGLSDLVSQQMDGQLDIIGTAAGIPISAASEVEAQRKINLFGIDGELRDKVLEEYPYFEPYTIPAGTYNQLDEDIETIAMFNFGITHKEMNADFVYDLVKAYHENIDKLKVSHAAAEEAVPEAILLNTSVPMHIGAIRYYEEIGIDLPDAVYPPEFK
ncbi:TAXI family TRAP transporter solute-binding subunit [Anaerobacillus sp. MEB173]|uniref:TAXI family TRAP transporter solute-binding subunit n=1 Tax=Anaerobacillus sp. MEB173 TaxID=3383345 RepID=UPI003F8E5F34